MFRRFKWIGALGVALTLALSAVPSDAQTNATVVLKSGERHTGHNVSFRVDRGQVVIRASQNEAPQHAVAQVAYVEFGNMPDVNVNLSGNQEAVVLRDGTILRGQIIELGHEQPGNEQSNFLVIMKTEAGEERRLNANQVSRVYFSGGAAAAAPTTGGQTGQTPSAGGGFVVSGQQQWTSTGLQVRRGEWLTFSTSGQVQLSSDTGDTATAAGSTRQRNPIAGAPLTNAPAGALVARVGNGQPFVVGSRTTVRMPDTGILFLGVNDDHVGDNSGEFRVEIQRGRR